MHQEQDERLEHVRLRGALVALLSLEPDMQVVAELDRGDTIVDTAVSVRPDVAVLDIDLPGLDGLALQNHVRGFIVKDAPVDTLADGIRRVALSNAIGKIGGRNRLDAIRTARGAAWL